MSDDGNDNEPDDTTIVGATVNFWITTADQSSKLSKQLAMQFTNKSNSFSSIVVDSTQTFQTVDGFGYTLTGGSASLISKLPPLEKASLLQELFSPSAESSICISYLRLSVGASDLSDSVFSYDDLPPGQTDEPLSHFSLGPDTVHLIPLLKEILAINPAIQFIAAPWSPPVWMKTNNSSIGGSLKPEYYDTYAQYFIKYIQAMQVHGITIHALTPQNEPLHPGNNPSLYMTAEEQADFIKNHMGPAFQAQGISTKIVAYDHNCDRPDYPLTILNDAAANPYVDGSAFHLYAGDISAMNAVHVAHPEKNLYFTEQYTASTGEFGGDLKWHLKNIIIGSMRNWSRIALEWNLANDPSFKPHTPGGCTTCKGALTIGTNISRNVAYYIIAHASKFVPTGSIRIASNIAGSLHNVAFQTPTGQKVLIVENDGNEDTVFNIKYKNLLAKTTLASGAVATYVW